MAYQSQNIYTVVPAAKTAEDIANHPVSKKTRTVARLNEENTVKRNAVVLSKPGMQVIRIITLN